MGGTTCLAPRSRSGKVVPTLSETSAGEVERVFQILSPRESPYDLNTKNLYPAKFHIKETVVAKTFAKLSQTDAWKPKRGVT